MDSQEGGQVRGIWEDGELVGRAGAWDMGGRGGVVDSWEGLPLCALHATPVAHAACIAGCG
eukprot:316649-Chlamydomonas_euryale.AAC.6